MTKDLNKAIMKRSKLRNTFLKEKSDSARKAYTSQRNLCVNLLRKTKKNYFANLDLNSITDSRKFWQTVKPLFSNKLPHKEAINLSENGQILNNDKKIAITFNNYFSNIKKLSLPSAKSYNEENIDNITNPTYLAIEKYKNHPSILTIKNKMQSLGHPSFSFQYVSHDQVLKEVNKLNPRKASQDSDIPVKVIRENIDIVAYFIYNNFNNSLSSSIFPTGLKYADIIPVFKKDDKTNKENYRPISILPNLSKIYERLMDDQLYPYFNKIFSKFQCGFRKGFNSQQCLLSMIEKWRRSLDSGGHAGAFLTDLLKAFDCINHKLLIAKLHAYGLDHGSLSFIHSYLSHRKQRTKVNSSYSDFAEIIFGVPQGSILGPLLFNIYICDLFFEDINLDVVNYADDTTPYSSGSDLNTIPNNLQKGVEKIFE